MARPLRRSRMILWMVLAAAAALVALLLVGRAAGNAKYVARHMLELGSLSMPARLEPRAPDESPSRVLFRFERIAGGFGMMGSHTPIRERLTVAVWPGETQGTSSLEREFLSVAAERVGDISWRRDGGLEIGTGIHRVNTNETPATVVVRSLPEHGLWLGYMAWTKDATAEEATATLEKIAASFAPAQDRDAFFAIVRDRPAKLRAERRTRLVEELARHGVALTADERPVERDGIAYFLSPDWKQLDGGWFFAMTPIGSLPASARPFRHHRPPPPDGLWTWPDIIYYAWRDGAWHRHSIDLDYTPPAALQPWIDAQLADPARAYFFAAHGIAVDETEPDQFGLDLLWTAPPRMRTLLADGGLVFPLE